MWREDFKCHRGRFRSSQHTYPVYAVTIEEKVALENRVKKISREADAPAAATTAVCAYKKLLKQNVASVNNYRFKNKPKGIHLHTQESF